MVAAIMLVILGISLLFFGLRIFYWLLPFMYALVGAGVGFWIAQWLQGTPTAETEATLEAVQTTSSGLLNSDLLPIILAVVFAVIFFLLSSTLEHIRRSLIGIGLGASLGALLASSLGMTGFGGIIVMAIGAFIGMLIVNAIFDPFIIVTTAIIGAGYVIDGANLLLPEVEILRRAQDVTTDFAPLVLWIGLTILGIFWQFATNRGTTERIQGRRR